MAQLPPSMPLSPPAMQAAPPSGDLSALLANLGLRPQDVPPDTMAQLGQIMRIVVQGLMEVLLARKQVKDNFRMAMTIIRPRENNPLKFSASPEDAMYTLFVKRNPGFLEPVEAFREAFDDLSFHQLATLAGMRAAFFATLSRFDPAALEAQWEKAAGKKQGGLFGGGKGANWEQFRQHYTRMTHDSEANFQQVFGEAFVRAYDDQIRKLQDARARHP
jgi:type VI secretion system FHA domain protein